MSDPAQAAPPVATPAPEATPAPVTPPAAQAAPVAAPQAQPAPQAAPQAQPEQRRELNPYARVARNAISGASEAAAQAATANAQLEAAKAELAAKDAVLKTHAAQALAALPNEKARKAVIESAGEDPTRQLQAIALLTSAGLNNPVLPGPATTAPAAAPPAPGTANDPDVAAYTRYKAAKDNGADLLAAQIRKQFGYASIEAGEKKVAAGSLTKTN